MHCEHASDFEIVQVETVVVKKHYCAGRVAWEREDAGKTGEYSFYCNTCGHYRAFTTKTKRPKWLDARLATIGLSL